MERTGRERNGAEGTGKDGKRTEQNGYNMPPACEWFFITSYIHQLFCSLFFISPCLLPRFIQGPDIS